ncbi:MAG: Gfo/Idh/MocA family oxidoreductase [Fibrella sp.]|nr:Gfo/Idh/MocA family oxidoreductase [Armatimonadota bacterium]
MKTYKIGVASLVHDHIWGELNHWKSLTNAQIVAAGDVNEPLRERFAQMFPEARLYPSWQTMLDAEGGTLDVVQCASENNVHANIVETSAERGLHVISEKPMAATFAQAKRMVDAAKRHNTRLFINWPTASNPAFQEWERRISAGEIGDVRFVRYRSAHNGPREIGCDPHFVEWLYDAEKNGAGAYMDYCCYGAVMCAHILGRASRVTALRGVLAKEYPLPDDAAVLTLQYPHALGVAEASWIQPSWTLGPNPVAFGSGGTIGVVNGAVVLQKVGGEVETIPAPATVSPRRSGPEYFLHCIETGAPIEGICNAETSLIAQETLSAGILASDTGVTQVL